MLPAGRLLLAAVSLLGAISTTSGQAVDYLAPIPAPPNVCSDTAPHCTDICDEHTGLETACNLNSPIGEYLRYLR